MEDNAIPEDTAARKGAAIPGSAPAREGAAIPGSTAASRGAAPAAGYVEYRNDEAPSIEDLPLCPVETTAQLIGSKWRLLILRDLLDGPRRFGQLKKSIDGISQKMLTANLRAMEQAGLVVRRVFPEVPPRVEYELTALGAGLQPVIGAMETWGEGYQAKARR